MATRVVTNVAVTTTAGSVLASNLARTTLTIRNFGNAIVYLGSTNAVTSANGWALRPGENWTDTSTDAVWAIGTDTSNLEVIEESAGSAVATTASFTVSEEISYTETNAAGVYTGTVVIPAGSIIHDIKVFSTVLWTASTSAMMDVGDAGDPDGWFTQINLKATDLALGEEINFIQTGGKEGAYLSLTTGLRTHNYLATASSVIGVVTTVGTTGTAGRTRMVVVYSTPVAVAATKV